MDYLLHHLLESAAAKTPKAPAASDRGRTLSYGDLNERANRLAHTLIEGGVARGDRVGLFLDKSLESIVAIYGVLKAGAAYVPFDPGAPPARLAYIAANAGIEVLVTSAEKHRAWGVLAERCPSLRALIVVNQTDAADLPCPEGVELLSSRDVERFDPSAPDVTTLSLDLAYILYTSGSTGAPKGVMLSHQNALAFVDWTVERFGVAADDRVSSHAPLHFDLSIFDLFAAASAGACVVLVPQEAAGLAVDVRRFIAGERITIWYSVPSILSMMTQRGGLELNAFPDLKTLLFAGEVFPTKYLRRLMELLPGVSFFNLYGPTETNVCTYYEVPPLPAEKSDAIPIGRAIANVEVFSVTADGRQAKVGEEGELFVRGPTVMQGYWGEPDRTEKSLVAHPFRPELIDRAYRTGDLVVEEGDGNFRLLGRRDHQIKSRGYRIEIGDIESCLYSHPDVVECAVVAIPDELITNKILAYVVVRNGTGRSQLARHCAERIPRYMIPESFEFKSSLPKTSTGKVDRQALSAAIKRGEIA